MDNTLAALQAELRDISFRLDVLEKRSGITIDAMPARRIADQSAEIETERESREDRSERRHQELLALVRQFGELLWQQRCVGLHEKHAAPVRRLQ